MNNEQSKSGLFAGVFCFVFWGMAPIYFKLLNEVNALTIIAHRLVWAVLCLLLFLLIRERQRFFQTIRIPFSLSLGLLLSGLLIISNWLIFVWAVTHDQILATSMGYFINPLINVLFGLLFLKERLTRIQTLALILAAFGTVFLAWYLGQTPWLPLSLAVTFGFYGLLRKRLQVRPMVGLFWESAWFLLPAILFLYFWADNHVWHQSMTDQWLLIGTGLITVIPLFAFNFAAKQLPLSMVGFLQYIAPTISFLIAVWFYDEALTLGHQVAFICIWLGLALITAEGVKIRRHRIP